GFESSDVNAYRERGSGRHGQLHSITALVGIDLHLAAKSERSAYPFRVDSELYLIGVRSHDAHTAVIGLDAHFGMVADRIRFEVVIRACVGDEWDCQHRQEESDWGFVLGAKSVHGVAVAKEWQDGIRACGLLRTAWRALGADRPAFREAHRF